MPPYRPDLRFRQVHLDFHTHEDIPGIADEFDPDQFADTLRDAHVDSINLFARCCHGYIYFQSERFADYQHPHLHRDLLREQIAACHARGIRTPIYITVQWDVLNARRHPQWLCRRPDGGVNIPVGTPGFFNHLCLNSPFRHWLKEFSREVLERLDGDGIWFDIVHVRDCCCEHCLSTMQSQGIDPTDETARHRFAHQTVMEFQREMSKHVRSINPDQLVFYNAGHIGPNQRDALDAFTHLELESLPGDQWGYDHFPQTARYARTLGKDFLGMTGKFHTGWGDFHSFKSFESLKYECALMLALGGKCCIGDQLHPSGKICKSTYDLIGRVYRHVAACEPYCRDAEPVCDIAVLTPEAFAGSPIGRPPAERVPDSTKGAARVLQELHQQFDIVDPHVDFGQYKLLVLPDEVPVKGELRDRITAYLQVGGRVIASHQAGLDERGRFALPIDARHDGIQTYEPTFIVPAHGFETGLPATEHVMHLRGSALADVGDAASILAEQTAPYFNRTWHHYCSHRHAPSNNQSLGPAVIESGAVLYFSHPIFTQFHRNAPPWVRAMIRAALQRVLTTPTLTLDGAPTTLVAAVNRQRTPTRAIVHLLHGIPVANARSIQTISDELPVHNMTVSLATATPATSVRLEPEDEQLPFEMQSGRTLFTVPRVGLHTMVVVE